MSTNIVALPEDEFGDDEAGDNAPQCYLVDNHPHRADRWRFHRPSHVAATGSSQQDHFLTSSFHELIHYAMPLVEKLFQPGLKYLKAGIMLGAIVPDNSLQGNLFLQNNESNQRQLMHVIDNINFSQRDDVVKYVASGLKRNWKMRQELRSPRYTTRWDELFEVK